MKPSGSQFFGDFRAPAAGPSAMSFPVRAADDRRRSPRACRRHTSRRRRPRWLRASRWAPARGTQPVSSGSGAAEQGWLGEVVGMKISAESGMLACGWCPGLMGKLSDLLEPTGSLPTMDFGSEAASGMGRRRRTRACGSGRGARTSRTARGCVTGTARAADTLSRDDSGRPSHLLQPGGGRS